MKMGIAYENTLAGRSYAAVDDVKAVAAEKGFSVVECHCISDAPDPGIVERIFDPYFTTWGLAEASGMGLTIAQSLVRDFGGTIVVHSEPGEGAVFEVFFPVAKTLDAAAASCPDPISQETGRILFVDDDGAVVDFGRQMLARLGYKAETAGDPLAALERFRQDPDGFDLIITDMTMPDMEGDDLIRELRAIRPEVPIILSTGHSDFMTDNDAAELGIQGILIKPYMSRELAAAIGRAMDGGEPRYLADSARPR